MAFDDFRKMNVWQLSVKLVKQIYSLTNSFPADERFGLISDMRRAANSIAHNIAEGFGRYEPKDKTRFYKISRGSCFEIMSQIFVSKELGFIQSDEIIWQITEDCKKIIEELNAIIKTLETRKF
ncbi:MAG: four helix bundle protein [Calditrichaeota bacterium]|nr:four helix bundle protein [Calditrichota bacterium]MCB9066596.1 four helix bundle protein [Calditrichia bacterium]